MSTYWSFGIDLPLAAVSQVKMRDVLSRIEIAYNDAAPMDLEPVFGPGLVYEGRSFVGIEGVDIEKGRLRIGGWGSNLDLLSGETSADGVALNRLDVMLRAISEVCSAAPGDIVGSVSIEDTEMDHAYPLVVCADGIVRMAHTPSGNGIGGEDVLGIGDALPLEALSVREERASVNAMRLRELVEAARPARPNGGL